jgi:hypothetical protein
MEFSFQTMILSLSTNAVKWHIVPSKDFILKLIAVNIFPKALNRTEKKLNLIEFLL